MTNDAPKILTISQVRANFSRLRKAIVQRGVVVHFGKRGKDELVLVSSTVLADLKASAASIDGSPRPR